MPASHLQIQEMKPIRDCCRQPLLVAILLLGMAFVHPHGTAAQPTTTPSSQASSPGPMHWIAKDGAPASVRRFVDSIPSRRDAYVASIQSNIASLKSQIGELKDQRDAAAKQGKVVWRTYSNGESESSSEGSPEAARQIRLLTDSIEQKWKEVHQEEERIVQASDPLWLPPLESSGQPSEIDDEPLPANYVDYLVKVPGGVDSAPAASPDASAAPSDPNCLTFAEPVWAVAGTAPMQALRKGVKGTGLQLKVIGDGMRSDSDDAAHLTLSAQRRSRGLGELITAPVAKFSLQNESLNVQWLSRDGEPGAVKALQYALLQTTDASGAVVTSLRFSPRTDATLDCSRDGTTKLPLEPPVIKLMNWTADGIPNGWELDKPATTNPVTTSGIALKTDNASVRVSYDATTGKVVLARSDDLQQRYDTVRAQLAAISRQGQGSGNIYGRENSGTDATRVASLRTELNTLQRQLYTNGQRWRALSSSTLSIVLPNGLELARFRLVANNGDAVNGGEVQPALAPLDPTRDYPVSVITRYPDDKRRAYFLAHARFKESQQRPGAPAVAPTDVPSGAFNRRDLAPGAIGSEVLAANYDPRFFATGHQAGA
jgi:hypothetical protein